MKNIQAIIVTYYPDLEVVKNNVKQLLLGSFLSKIHIIDNTPLKIDFSSITLEKISVTHLGKNKGIAYAQNIGLKCALGSKADYIILFDQDSKIQSGMISSLVFSMERSKKNNLKLACIGPRIIDSFSGKKVEPKVQIETKTAMNVTICKQIIASGKLIDSNALKDIGLMDCSLFIDGVDHEWCWRAKTFGYQVAISESTFMSHTLGDGTINFLGVNYRLYPPIRMYYQFRNSLILLRKNYVPLYSKVRSLVNIVFRFIAFGFIRKDHQLYRKYMLYGVIDGIRNKRGSYDSR